MANVAIERTFMAVLPELNLTRNVNRTESQAMRSITPTSPLDHFQSLHWGPPCNEMCWFPCRWLHGLFVGQASYGGVSLAAGREGHRLQQDYPTEAILALAAYLWLTWRITKHLTAGVPAAPSALP